MSQGQAGGRRGRPAGKPGLSWRSFFQQTITPLFVLGPSRRIRYVNPAWEKLTGTSADAARGMVCSRRRHSSPLAATLAPTSEALAGRVETVRRPAPGCRYATQWWDITFVPLPGDGGCLGILGIIEVVGDRSAPPARKLPPWLADLRQRHAAAYSWDLFADEQPHQAQLLAQLQHAATAEVPLWLYGPPGCGKETTARLLHAHGPRRHLAFLAVDCPGLQPYLIESLLFAHGGLLQSGHVGTVYLKEPAALPRELQQRLADEIHERPSTLRWICGATRPAAELAAAGQLVPEFPASFAVLEIRLPPAVDRREEWPAWLARWCGPRPVDAKVWELLQTHAWPGQLREMRQVLHGAAAELDAAAVLRPEHLPLPLRLRAGHAPPPPRWPMTLDELLLAVEKRLVQLALEQCGHNHTAAAERLGIFRSRLLRRLDALGLASRNRPADGMPSPPTSNP